MSKTTSRSKTETFLAGANCANLQSVLFRVAVPPAAGGGDRLHPPGGADPAYRAARSPTPHRGFEATFTRPGQAGLPERGRNDRRDATTAAGGGGVRTGAVGPVGQHHEVAAHAVRRLPTLCQPGSD